ncbi:FAD binding domain-containing protein [Aspergillus pseudocaelatus]|uniref:FAD binding domain-containing protein n=1 Tax=Aspergillus pseudocaelatus TaxID=1825620 RepID=A0ABQ6W9Y8_9EURO|nr:FAD binding domain-containing protein [Aspergillus pseudocaelatus]
MDVLPLSVIDCHKREIVPVRGPCEYVALSYVWGQTAAQGVPKGNSLPPHLPCTVEDAMTVVREVGLQYLWVDRYCLDQSNKAEFEAQLNQMADIYRNALITIIGAAGSNGGYGLPGVSSRPRIKQPCIKIGDYTLWSSMTDPRKLVRESPWMTRAWTYQEGVFSRNWIAFTDEQVFFQRSNEEQTIMERWWKTSCEMFPYGGLGADANCPLLNMYDKVWQNEGAIHQLLAQYTARRLTYQSDAINGTLGLLKRCENGPYRMNHYFGIPILGPLVSHRKAMGRDPSRSWPLTEAFLVNLCWKTRGTGPRRAEFPSWSWAGWQAVYEGSAQPLAHYGLTGRSLTKVKLLVEMEEDLADWEAMCNMINWDLYQDLTSLPRELYMQVPTVPLTLCREVRGTGDGFAGHAADLTPMPWCAVLSDNECEVLIEVNLVDEEVASTFQTVDSVSLKGIILRQLDPHAAQEYNPYDNQVWAFALVVLEEKNGATRVGSLELRPDNYSVRWKYHVDHSGMKNEKCWVRDVLKDYKILWSDVDIPPSSGASSGPNSSILAPSVHQPVIIVGASLVGLSAALCLSKHKVPTIVLEKHASIAKHPRAIGFTARTLEIYRWLGIADEIPEIPKDFNLMRARVESMTGKWFESTSWSDTGSSNKKSSQELPATKKQYSPSRGAALPQDQLEAILQATAIERGADIRRQHRVTNVEQSQSGVSVTVCDPQNREMRIEGSYLIAADGNRSTVRELLQIPRNGRGHMQTMRSVLFRAPLEQYMQGVHQFSIDQPDLKAFMTTYNDGRWVLMFHDDVERDEPTLRSAINQAIGRSDLPVDIITTGRWDLAALVADTFQSGRVFLAGDAAHTLPPNRGGYGANTGIHDVDNLAWKLAAVLAGKSSPELLDTYDAERRPVALLRHDQIFARADYKVHLDKATPAGKKLDDDAMEFGQLYLSNGFIGAENNLPRALKPDEWAGQPGTHVPHFWVTQDENPVSILDVVGEDSWTLVSESVEWEEVVAQVNLGSSITLKHICIGRDVQFTDEGSFQEALGVSATGASLLRPDGYIAWRTKELPENPAKCLDDIVAQVAFRVNSH